MFMIPFAVLIALSIIYRNDLGFKVLLSYFAIWLVGILACVLLHLPGFLFVAYQALLAAVMYIHVKMRG